MMKKKVLCIFLAATLIGISFSPVYGTEFTSSGDAEEVFSTGIEENGSDNISEPESQIEKFSEIPDVNVSDEFPAFYCVILSPKSSSVSERTEEWKIGNLKI